MPRTLLAKLTAALLLLMIAVGAFTALLATMVNRLYLDEMQQRLNRDVAGHIVEERLLLRDGEVDHDGLEHVFHMMMVVHPSIELYLLGTDGEILAYSAPEGRVKADRVSLEPIASFLRGSRLPLLGDDPREPSRRRPFSAAEIRTNGALEGYLYIIVGGESFLSTVDQLTGSYVARLGVGVLVLGQVLALGTAYMLGRWVVRRLRSLRAAMVDFERSGFKRRAAGVEPAPLEATDEIGELRASFDALSRRMTALLDDRDRADRQRRELVASISHDLRTPLASIRGYLETLTLKADTLTAEERRDCIRVARRQGLRLQRLIDDLFELSRLDADQVELQREPFSIAELVQDVVQKFEPEAARRKIRIRARVSEHVPVVEADLGLIERVLSNLVDNALKYTDEGGSVEVSTQGEGQAVAVEVRDDGAGIPREELPLIFEPHYRGRSARGGAEGGTGLGLAIASRILGLHASRIVASSDPSQGTTFRFRLPAAGRAAS